MENFSWYYWIIIILGLLNSGWIFASIQISKFSNHLGELTIVIARIDEQMKSMDKRVSRIEEKEI